MKRAWLALIIIQLAAACGQDKTPSATPSGRTDTLPVEAIGENATLTGDMELVLFDDTAPVDAPEKPTFRITSSKCTHLGDKIWAFEDAHAVIYNRDAAETMLEAGEGRIDQNTKHALLAGGVTLREGDMAIQLADLEWSNADRLAKSDQAATIVHGGTRLGTASLRFYPDQRRLILKDVKGLLQIRQGETP